VHIYSACNHKRATAAKCRESHQRRTDATTAEPFPDSGGVTHGILQRWHAYDCTQCIIVSNLTLVWHTASNHYFALCPPSIFIKITMFRKLALFQYAGHEDIGPLCTAVLNQRTIDLLLSFSSFLSHLCPPPFSLSSLLHMPAFPHSCNSPFPNASLPCTNSKAAWSQWIAQGPILTPNSQYYVLFYLAYIFSEDGRNSFFRNTSSPPF
jgi:hypothetical protein